MTEGYKQDKRPRLANFVPFRSQTGEVKNPEKFDIDVDNLYGKVSKMIDLASMKQLGGVVGAISGGDGRLPAASGKSDMEAVAGVAKLLGVDLSKIMESRDKELEALRNERDASSKETHEMRLALYDRSLADIKSRMDEFMKEVKGGGNQTQGIFGLADQVLGGELSKQVIQKGLGINQPIAPQPKDPLDQLIETLSMTSRLKEALGVGHEDRSAITAAALQNAKVETLKVLLEDERSRTQLEQANSLSKMKIERLGGFLDTLTNSLPDVIEAVVSRGGSGNAEAAAAAVGRVRENVKKNIEKQQAAEAPPGKPQAQTSANAQAAAAPAGDPADPSTWTFDEVVCPHPGCGKTIPFPRELPAGLAWTCPYCKKPIQKTPEEPLAPGGTKPEDKGKEAKVG